MLEQHRFGSTAIFGALSLFSVGAARALQPQSLVEEWAGDAGRRQRRRCYVLFRWCVGQRVGGLPAVMIAAFACFGVPTCGSVSAGMK